MAAICHEQLYQRRVARTFNKKVWWRKPDRQKEKLGPVQRKREACANLWRPYVVKKVFSREDLVLADMDGEEFQMPMNFDNKICYYA